VDAAADRRAGSFPPQPVADDHDLVQRELRLLRADPPAIVRAAAAGDREPDEAQLRLLHRR
jgi:hypothetical protein